MASRRHAFIYQRSLERRTDYQPPADPPDTSMTPQEVREYLNCSASMVRKLRQQGEITSTHKVGSAYRYARESVEGYKSSMPDEDN